MMTDLVVQPALPLSDTSSDTVVSHTSTVRRDGKQRNLPIQWLRAIAAILVMLYHTGVYQAQYLGRSHNLFPETFGYFGVALFFAISGYLMSIAVRVQTPFMFLMHRVARIYPIYLLAVAIFYVLWRFLGEANEFVPSSLLLMPTPSMRHALLGVEWTLVYEIFFYVGLFLISWIGLAERIVPIGCLWLCLIALSSLIAPDDGAQLHYPLDRMPLLSVCAPMAGGLLVPFLLKKVGLPAWLLICFAGLVYVGQQLLSLNFSRYYDTSRLLFGICAIFIVWAAVKLSSRPYVLDLGIFGRMMAAFGDYSYALYLCHVPLILMIHNHVQGYTPELIWILTVIVPVMASILLGRVDLVLYGWAKRALKAISPNWVKVCALLYLALFVSVSAQGTYRYYWAEKLGLMGKTYAASMLAQGPIHTEDDAAAMALKAGFIPDNSLIGRIDVVKRVQPGDRFYLDGWALDMSSSNRFYRADHLALVLIRDGRFLASLAAESERSDVAKAYGKRGDNAFHIEHSETCSDSHVIALVFTADRHFSVLPPGQTEIACPP